MIAAHNKTTQRNTDNIDGKMQKYRQRNRQRNRQRERERRRHDGSRSKEESTIARQRVRYLRLAQQHHCLHGPDLVVAVGGDVAHPGQCLVAALLNYLQIAHLDARRGKVRDLKVDGNGRTLLLLLALDRWQAKVRLESKNDRRWRRGGRQCDE